MAQHERPEFTFLDDQGRPLDADGVDDEVVTATGERRGARLEQWLPGGGGAAIASLVLVLVAWLGATPLVSAVAVAFPQGEHRIGSLDEESLQVFGNGQYYGVTPGLIPVITYGTRAVVVGLALLLAVRARRHERSALATAAVLAAAVSLVLLALAAALMGAGFAAGHGGGYYSNLY